MKAIAQTFALLRVSLSSLRYRLGISLVTVVGVACAVGVLVSMLSMGAGARRMVALNARSDRAIVISKNAESVFGSHLQASTVTAIEYSVGVRKWPNGSPVAATQTLVRMDVRNRTNNLRSNAPLLGVSGKYFNVYPEVDIIEGRVFRPGLHELIVGRTRSQISKGLNVGESVPIQGSMWTVVGRFSANGEGIEDSLLGDEDSIVSAFKLNGTQMVTALLESPQMYQQLSEALRLNPSVEVAVWHDADWGRKNIEGLTGILDFVSYFVATVMALGASFAALNVMYMIVERRRREIATLRAIGFGAGAVVVSVLLESTALAVLGAIMGVATGWLCFNGYAARPMGSSVQLAVTPAIVALGTTWALAIGFVGGLLPALRAARTQTADALSAL